MESNQSLTNSEILMANKKLIDTCISFQVTKYKQFKYLEDIRQEIYLIILEYNNEKLNAMHRENHINAFVTGVLYRQLYSQTSPFYRKYKKFQMIAPYEINYLIEAEK